MFNKVQQIKLQSSHPQWITELKIIYLLQVCIYLYFMCLIFVMTHYRQKFFLVNFPKLRYPCLPVLLNLAGQL